MQLAEEWVHGVERPSRVQTPSETDDLSTLVESTTGHGNYRPLKRALALATPMDPVNESEDTRQVFDGQPMQFVLARMDSSHSPGPSYQRLHTFS
jgi:hypothetical protein